MIYEHKILKTFTPIWKRPDNTSLSEHTEMLLNQASTQGWQIASAINEFDFVLQRPVQEAA